MRPQTAAHYEHADVVTQTAILIAAVALAHAFLDGNKRTAMIAGAVFLDFNGFTTDFAPNDDALGCRIETLVADHQRADTLLNVSLTGYGRISAVRHKPHFRVTSPLPGLDWRLRATAHLC